jgi:hypothetical protein
LGTFENLPDDRCIAGIAKGRQAGINAEIAERSEYRIPISFCSLFVVFGQGKKEFQDLFLRNAGQIAFAELGIETGENELTGFDSIFFWSWPCDTADGCRLPGILS